MERLIGTYIFDPEIVEGKMIFLVGPRQVGKTTFARNWLKSLGSEGTYFNWDDPAVMVGYKKNPLYFRNTIDEEFIDAPVPLVFDEIHKHKEWRNVLKGFFDTNQNRMKLLVTGSARLGFATKSGDSLLGRYFSFQMLPLGLPEVMGDFAHVLQDERAFADGNLLAKLARVVTTQGAENGLELLMKFGGFPEPLLKGSERFHRRWQTDYKTLLTKEDVRDLSRISDIKGLESLVEILPTKVGSSLSIPSISEDLGRKYDTIKNWLEILEGLYMIFTLRPWHRRITRTIKKQKKLYFLDWSLLPDTGSRFENLVAVALLKMAARFTETGLGSHDIRYIRDREKREVDFVLVKDNEPLALFEAKESDANISKSAAYYSLRMKIPFFQIVKKAKKVETFPDNRYVIPALNFLMLIG
ncbi:MAG: ATP-binding protein [Deltaproteobacteria bacterium]|nr:ATP-binding protein [Deltaproteobacteria bacterium]MBW2319136.1 ATP-binding protein [Deltaproteobacteria bacterium]